MMACLNLLGSIVGLLLVVHAVRRDEEKHDLLALGLAQSNSSLREDLSTDECNALLFTVVTSDSDVDRKEIVKFIQSSLFESTGLDVLASMMTDGTYNIKLTQALQTGGTNMGANSLILQRQTMEELVYNGSFYIGEHKLGWVARKSKLEWSDDAVQKSIDLGVKALSASCFLIVGSAFIAECITERIQDVFALDALMIVDSAPILRGSSILDMDSKISDLVTGSSISELRSLFTAKCIEVLRASVGDVISPIPNRPLPGAQKQPDEAHGPPAADSDGGSNGGSAGR
eukprot:TRINITY_DN5153_c0_g1_i2.p1 TRINITY_DN5153_c0_g1~~TRINITY_DN5153_c0_g1_i2.p1  ORF type:complete len:318 (-),score=36.59 TRINITY_DN5153_c0_g1_i2:70-930(-)